MTSAVFGTIKAIATQCGFACTGDVIHAMGGLGLGQREVNRAIATATSCVACPVGWRLTSVDIYDENVIIEVRLEPTPHVLGLAKV